jgi:hypothetical protein
MKSRIKKIDRRKLQRKIDRELRIYRARKRERIKEKRWWKKRNKECKNKS